MSSGVLIKAVVKPARLDAVLRVLLRMGVRGIAAQNAVGLDADADYGWRFKERAAIEFAVPAGMAAEILDALVAAARTGRKDNDGKVFIIPLAAN